MAVIGPIVPLAPPVKSVSKLPVNVVEFSLSIVTPMSAPAYNDCNRPPVAWKRKSNSAVLVPLLNW